MNTIFHRVMKSMLAVGLLTIGSQSVAAEVANHSVASAVVEVQWGEPNDFTDIDPGNQSKRGFNQRLFSQFEKHFAKLAEQLPQGYLWTIKVIDIDLAGRVSHQYSPTHEPLRVIDHFFTPKVVLSYQLIDAQGKLVSSADELILKDNMMEQFPAARFMQHAFAYEKHLIKKWFKQSLLSQAN